jgi:hypothetical protein
MDASCEYLLIFHDRGLQQLLLTLDSANIVIILVTGSFTVHFASQNRKARAGELTIQGKPGFLYTL